MASNEFIKKPHVSLEYTHEQVQELKKCAEDPIYFISNYCFIRHQTLGKIKFKLRPYQIQIIKGLQHNRWVILLQGRQSGKSETTSAFAYWFSIFHDSKNVLLASNKQRGATDLMNRIRFMYENTPDFLRAGVVSYNRGSIEFDNGSMIWSEATTETTGRGRSLALMIADELAHVPKRIQEEMWSSLAPTLSTGGSCVVMSTPNGDTDLFADLWRGAEAGNNGFVPIEVTAEEIPDVRADGTATTRADPVWQKMMEAKVGELKFKQEYLNIFLSSDALLIKSMTLQALNGAKPIFTDKGFTFWKEPSPHKTYLVAADVAEGVNQDYSTIQVLELETLEQVAEFRNNTINESQLYNALKFIITKLLSYSDPRTGQKPTVYWSFENNSAGAAISTLYYNDEKFPPEVMLLSGKGERSGFRTVNKPKLEACRHLKNLVEKVNGGLRVNSKTLIFELKNYVVKGASYAAKPGATDDLISAFLIIMRMIKQLSEYEPDVFNKLYQTEQDFHTETSNEFDDPMPFII